mmetsp:Transcript_34532/g.77491  ORF Transcript_34532/g.77491 Transcript_34532/m.77491 type:complete len:346 (+) Transcript_34532:89-1126(+)
MGDTLDDDFAAFLTAIDDVGKEENLEAEAPPATKRARVDDGHDSLHQASRDLLKASYLGKTAKVEALLASLSAVDRLLLVDLTDPEDTLSALHLAVIQGHLDVAKVLLKRRADVDVTSSSGDTPLMWAAHQGNSGVVKELLRAGADATLKNQRGSTAAKQAMTSGHRRLHDYLENHAFDVSAGLKRRAASRQDAAAARRAANAALVEAALQKQREQEEEEAFWAGVKARREGRESSEAQPPQESKGVKAPEAKKAFAEAETSGPSLHSLPVHVRPHFLTLGAEPDVTEAEVRRLYRQLALKHHPDKNPERAKAAKEQFTKVAIAYDAVCEYLAGRPQVNFYPPPS